MGNAREYGNDDSDLCRRQPGDRPTDQALLNGSGEEVGNRPGPKNLDETKNHKKHNAGDGDTRDDTCHDQADDSGWIHLAASFFCENEVGGSGGRGFPTVQVNCKRGEAVRQPPLLCRQGSVLEQHPHLAVETGGPEGDTQAFVG